MEKPAPRLYSGKFWYFYLKKNYIHILFCRYVLQLGTIPVPKSSNPGRIKQNIDIFDFELSPEDMQVLDGYNKNYRAVPAEELKESNEYPFKGVEFWRRYY